MKEIRRALFSVSDTTGVVEFARGLAARGVEIIATSGTATTLREGGLDVTAVEDLTGAAEMLGGRVKTLHPAVHGGILARQDDEDDLRSLADRGIEPIDLVCVNLYPFRLLSLRRGVSEEEMIEHVDVGGPAMLRAAAKNFRHVAVLCAPERYGFVLDEITQLGGLTLETRRELAADAFAHTAGYDIAVASWFTDAEPFPDRLFYEFQRVEELPYGENPHQRAAYYRDRSARRDVLSMVHRHQGRAVSFNNVADLSAGRELLREFTVPGCVIIKHQNPCGVALAPTVEEAYTRALAADPRSAFGGVVVVNRAVTRALAEALVEQFTEVLFAPGYDEDALAVLGQRPALRVLENRERRRVNPGERDLRRVMGGALVQDLDTESEERDLMQVVTERHPTEAEWGDLVFAWRVAKHVGSNAIVVARDLQTLGVGAGQMSRVDAVRLALVKSPDDLGGAVLASDGFFPFPDGPEAALERGVGVLVQPGGAKADAEIVAAVDRRGGAMVFTGRRHFSH